MFAFLRAVGEKELEYYEYKDSRIFTIRSDSKKNMKNNSISCYCCFQRTQKEDIRKGLWYPIYKVSKFAANKGWTSRLLSSENGIVAKYRVDHPKKKITVASVSSAVGANAHTHMSDTSYQGYVCEACSQKMRCRYSVPSGYLVCLRGFRNEFFSQRCMSTSGFLFLWFRFMIHLVIAGYSFSLERSGLNSKFRSS